MHSKASNYFQSRFTVSTYKPNFDKKPVNEDKPEAPKDEQDTSVNEANNKLKKALVELDRLNTGTDQGFDKDIANMKVLIKQIKTMLSPVLMKAISDYGLGYPSEVSRKDHKELNSLGLVSCITLTKLGNILFEASKAHSRTWEAQEATEEPETSDTATDTEQVDEAVSDKKHLVRVKRAIASLEKELKTWQGFSDSDLLKAEDNNRKEVNRALMDAVALLQKAHGALLNEDIE